MDDTTCDGCVYAIITIGDDKIPNVKCRRYPPQIFVLHEQVSQSFPDAISRCGEFKKQRVGFIEAWKESMKEVDNDG